MKDWMSFKLRRWNYNKRQYLIRLSRFRYFSQIWLGSHFSPRLLPKHIRPYGVSVKLTENCQAKCVTCDYWKTKWENGFDTDQAVALLNRLSDIGVRSIRFTGGEPLLRKDFFEILRRANTKRFLSIELQTNGLLLKRLAKEINESPVTHVSVSVDGMEATNDVTRGVKGYFRTAFEGLQAIQGKQLKVCTTITRQNANELDELIEYAKQTVGASFSFNVLDNRLYFLKGADMDLRPSKEQMGTILNIFRHKLRLPEYEVNYFMKYLKGTLDQEPPCILGFTTIDVSSNGDVYTGCLVLPPVGNLLKDDPVKLFESKAYRERVLAMVRHECPGCVCAINTSLKFQHLGTSPLVNIKRRLFPVEEAQYQ
jgi:MoaA/NifB/PqqE/SkfB family radical SAM enzyme